MCADRVPPEQKPPSTHPQPPTGSGSMHDHVEVWDDCCVCEPEPRWQALAEEMEAARPDHEPQGPASPPA